MGYILALLSPILHASKDLASKGLSSRIDGTTSTFASFYYALPFYALLFGILSLFGVEFVTISKQMLVLVLLRSISDVGAEWTKMQAIACGDISLVAPFMSLSTIFLLFLSPWITGDQLTLVGVLATVVSFVGTIILLKKPTVPYTATNWRGVKLGLATSFCFALNICFDRLAVQVASPVFSGFTMTLFAALFFAPVVMTVKSRRDSMTLAQKPLLVRGFLEVAFMVTKLSALMYLQAPYVAALNRLSLLISILGGRFIFKEGDFVRRIVAGVLVVAGAVIALFGE